MMKLPPLGIRIVVLLVIGGAAIAYKLSLVPRAILKPGIRPPALIGTSDDWINTPPLTWTSLTGHVVLVQFWEFSCANCRATHPALNAWQRQYAKDGLVILGIHSPEFAANAPRAAVAKAVRAAGITYPVLNDPHLANWRAFQQDYWPTLYLIDRAGTVDYVHVGEGAYDTTERRIRHLLYDTPAPTESPAGPTCSPQGCKE
jgi:thiol-disulfide isomerase/thioredoxin